MPSGARFSGKAGPSCRWSLGQQQRFTRFLNRKCHVSADFAPLLGWPTGYSNTMRSSSIYPASLSSRIPTGFTDVTC